MKSKKVWLAILVLLIVVSFFYFFCRPLTIDFQGLNKDRYNSDISIFDLYEGETVFQHFRVNGGRIGQEIPIEYDILINDVIQEKHTIYVKANTSAYIEFVPHSAGDVHLDIYLQKNNGRESLGGSMFTVYAK